MFRLVDALVAAGHECVVYLTDRHGWEMSQHMERIRTGWPAMTAPVRDYRQGIEDCHAVFATGWESAWSILRSSAKGLRCYLVQDFEPAFYPAGSEYLLAEATYRFGFTGITAGAWLAKLIYERYGMSAVGFEFGSDLDSYHLLNEYSRHGVCYYSRPSTPRRAHELAMVALKMFAAKNPDVPIHTYGETVRGLHLAAEQHGVLSPRDLNILYNRVSAGLVLSATNVSLAPYEMLASGCIPVVNGAEHNRLVLANSNVRFVDPNPVHLAQELERLVRLPADQQATQAKVASMSVSSRSWVPILDQFVDTMIRLVSEASEKPTNGG